MPAVLDVDRNKQICSEIYEYLNIREKPSLDKSKHGGI
jgi:hypothetical protein